MSSDARLNPLLPLLVLFLASPLFAKQPALPVSSSFFTASDGVKIHYLEAGQGETLLFVPGWLMPADIWDLQLQALAQDHHVIALDPRSQGLSDLTATGNEPLRRSKDIAELLEHLKIPSTTLVGWALGAFDCLAYLRQFGGDKVKALVLVDSPLAAPSGPNPTPTRGTFLRRFEHDHINAGTDYVRSLFKDAPPATLFKKLVPAAARVPANIALAALDNTRPGDIWQPSMTLLNEIPLLYAITPTYAAQAAYLKTVVPNARVETFEDSGHALFVDDAERFNILLRDFLQQAALVPRGLPKKKRRSIPAPTTSPLPTPTEVSTYIPTPTAATFAAPEASPTEEAFVGTATPVPGRPHLFNPIALYQERKLHRQQTATAEATSRPSLSPTDTATSMPTSTPSVILPTSTESPTPQAIPIEEGATPTPGKGPYLEAVPTDTPRYTIERHRPTEKTLVSDGYFATDDHVKLHYLEAGQGLPIIFIPGWILPAEIWRLQLESLAEDYHVIALDPRSQGDSQMTHQGNDPIRQAQDIQQLMDHLQLNSVVLVGWSHGAFQVLAYEGRFGTDRLYAMALVDSPLAPATANQAATASRVRFLKNFQKDRAASTRGFVWGLFKNHPPGDFTKKLYQAASRTPTDIALALMNNAFPGDTWQPAIQVMRQIPMLYAVTPKYTAQAQYLTSVDPLAKVEFFNNSGHALFVDEPDHFNETMREFLRQASVYPAGLPTRPKKK